MVGTSLANNAIAFAHPTCSSFMCIYNNVGWAKGRRPVPTDRPIKGKQRNMTDTLLNFPCEFVIKAFGLKNEDFEKAVLSIINTHCKDLAENALNYRPSQDNKYLSISIKINAESKEQLDTLYRELSADSHVLMVL